MSSSTPGARILIVDDEAVIRTVIERLLLARDEQVTTAASSAEAVATLERTTFDLVVTDIRMPGGGGAAVARIAERLKVPIIFITGYADTGDVQRYLDGGAPVVRKPFKPNELLDAVDGALARPHGS